MAHKNIDDYLQEGIHGGKDLNPEEKKLFLSTFRERVELALTIGQVMQASPYPEVVSVMKTNKNSKLLLNGTIAYSFLSKYISLANDTAIPFSIIQNQEGHTPIGLVVASSAAVDRPNIYVKDEIWEKERPQ
ncbi:YueI family protein [Bacillus sp. 165]|uniref:YueI family protein n=1 Tax=Bacillus sp. 165 TaxID=1529117 RepID=UPI001ADB8A99|nr:YueI family protein [Bacillus sp. 165]MBO9129313.1 YueI family protein [Bacillus sp. 165]